MQYEIQTDLELVLGDIIYSHDRYIDTSTVTISWYIVVSSGINQPKLIGFHGN